MKWTDIPLSAKMTAASVVVIMSAIAYLSTYQTDVEAQQYRQYHQGELVRFREQQVQEQIDQYRFQLLSGGLSAEQRAWIEAKIRELESFKACIRRREC